MVLERILATLTSSYANNFFYSRDKNLSVTNSACFGSLLDSLNNLGGDIIRYNDFHFYFGNKQLLLQKL